LVHIHSMFNLFSKKHIVAVHDGRFHSDDIFACAVLHLVHKGNIKILRTRDKNILVDAEYIIDVGGIYDHSRKMYDHHQTEGAGIRINSIPYASFGLIWKHYGHILAPNKHVWNEIDRKIVQPIDAGDNGISVYETKFEGIKPYEVHSIVSTRAPSWDEEDMIDLDHEFKSLVVFAADLLSREIEKATSTEKARILLKADYDKAVDKEIIELSVRYPFEKLLPEYPEPQFVIYLGRNGLWRAEGVPVKANEFFNRRQYFPRAWSGLRDEALQEVTGVRGALFCHRDVFMCVGKTRKDVLELARKALVN
jgi:uncharacterized UPF0160 family protein